MKKVLVAGAGGFIGGYLAENLLKCGHTVRCVDHKSLDKWFKLHTSAENICADLQEKQSTFDAVEGVEEVYNFACNMGGMGFVENNKALCMLSVLINTHLLMASHKHSVNKYFFASSACVYPMHKQENVELIELAEDTVYPAMPEDGYGWEKLFSERMCRHFFEDFGLNVRVARFHNVYGPHGSWSDGREKAPAAVCRKIIEAAHKDSKEIEVWGDGKQVRSFTYIEDCITGIGKLMESDISEPLNIGSSEQVTINDLIDIVASIAGVEVTKKHLLDAPLGVRARNSHNEKIKTLLDWEPKTKLEDGLKPTYEWILARYQEMS